MQVTLDVSVEDLVDGILENSTRHEPLIELILALDLQIADASFTEELIKKLLSSLSGDLDEGDWKVLMKELAALRTPEGAKP